MGLRFFQHFDLVFNSAGVCAYTLVITILLGLLVRNHLTWKFMIVDGVDETP